MRIKAITIENFKGISEPVRIEFKSLTLLFGPNSSGKSTIIQTLHYIKEVLEHGRLDVDKTASGGDFIDLGGFDNFVHGHDTSKKVSFLVELQNVNPQYGWDFTFRDNGEGDKLLNDIESAGNKWLWFSVAKINGELCVDDFIICMNGIVMVEGYRLKGKIEYNRFVWPKTTDIDQCEGNKETVIMCQRISGLFESYDIEKIRLLIRMMAEDKYQTDIKTNILPKYGEISPYRGWNSDGDIKDQAYDYAERSVIGTIVDELKNMLYVGPLRTIPPRNYSPQKTFAASRWADGLAAWDKASDADDGKIDQVNHWLGKMRFNTGYKLIAKTTVSAEHPAFAKLATAQRLSLKERQHLLESIPKKREVQLVQERGEVAVSLCDIGVGISQSFPVVMAVLDETAKTIIIEQPELHIHPRLQVELGDLFIAAANSDSGKCMIIETHSEHLILRLMRRMHETFNKNLPEGIPAICPSDVSIIYVQPSDNGPVLMTLELDAEGKLLDPWPGGFFEEGFRERFA